MSYNLKSTRILIVDDMVPMLTLATSVLKIFGFEKIYTANDGKKAFESVCEYDPDLIITDWIMDPVDGLELAKMVRKNPRAPNPFVPIMMMTGFSARVRVEQARDSGITEFMVKPFSANDLNKRITQIIENPRQFVEAGEFFGPDRRRKKNHDYDGPRRRKEDFDPEQQAAILTDLTKKAKQS